jgi:signal transduction histidine kinase
VVLYPARSRFIVRNGSINAILAIRCAGRWRCVLRRRGCIPKYQPGLFWVIQLRDASISLMRGPAATNANQKVRDPSRRGVRVRQNDGLESLIGELSTAMTRAPAHAVDHEIETWLGKICLALDLDRSAVYERDGPDQPVNTTHTWVRANFPPFPRDYDPEKLFKTTADWVMAGNQFTFSRPSDSSDELGDARLFVERYGPKASAVLPMWAGNRVIGAASFGKFRSAREWPPELLEHLGLAVRLFGSAIERKQAEASSREARTELRIASRRNMMSELVASLAHEINQPLAAILSNLGGLGRLLSLKNPDTAMALAAVNNAIEDTKRAAEIIRRVRAMLKGHAEHKIAVGVGALVAEVVKLIASEAALRQISVRIEASPSVPRVIGDPIQLQQCVLNLLMNALEAITETKSHQREVTIKITLEKAGWVGVSVCDTGAGIDPAVAHRLFQPFATTKNQGMGLGLLVTRSIVENHGGRIWSTPNPDSGTTFTFTLPVAERKRANPSRRAR